MCTTVKPKAGGEWLIVILSSCDSVLIINMIIVIVLVPMHFTYPNA